MALLALKAAGIAIGINYGAHVTSSHLFYAFCTPQSLWDIPLSVVTTASPVCSFLLNVMQLTQNNFAVGLTTTIAALAAGALRTMS
jgi:predicted ABC-type sugar transport system permease subunit